MATFPSDPKNRNHTDTDDRSKVDVDFLITQTLISVKIIHWNRMWHGADIFVNGNTTSIPNIFDPFKVGARNIPVKMARWVTHRYEYRSIHNNAEPKRLTGVCMDVLRYTTTYAFMKPYNWWNTPHCAANCRQSAQINIWFIGNHCGGRLTKISDGFDIMDSAFTRLGRKTG